MVSATPLRVRRDEQEYLDSPDRYIPELEANLRDIRRLNAWFGGTRLAVHGLGQVLEGKDRARVLDVATGSGDIPLAMTRWGRSRGLDLRVVGADVSPLVVAAARRHVAGSDVRLAQADARALPWRDETFDVVCCCLALHHFPPDEAVQVLREMWRVASHAILVTDLTRSVPAYVGTWLATRTIASNVLTRHDGPLSVLRAYTPDELRQLAKQADVSPATVKAYPLFRQLLVAWKDGRSIDG